MTNLYKKKEEKKRKDLYAVTGAIGVSWMSTGGI
jgi:hypothetical protein